MCQKSCIAYRRRTLEPRSDVGKKEFRSGCKEGLNKIECDDDDEGRWEDFCKGGDEVSELSV